MTDASEYRLLCVFAHPDDESYGPGATLAQCALDGVDVHILMFTCGEAGSIGVSKEMPNDQLCAARRVEMVAACEALGVKSHRILGVPDKGVAATDEDAAVAEILADIGRFRPQVVLTFHREGVSSHPDHIAVTRFLDRAFLESGDEGPSRFYEWGIPQARSHLYDRPNLKPMPDAEITASVSPSSEAIECKIAAIEAHVTQIEFYHWMQERFDYRTGSVPEYFALRRVRGPHPDGVLGGLFEGVRP